MVGSGSSIAPDPALHLSCVSFYLYTRQHKSITCLDGLHQVSKFFLFKDLHYRAKIYGIIAIKIIILVIEFFLYLFFSKYNSAFQRRILIYHFNIEKCIEEDIFFGLSEFFDPPCPWLRLQQQSKQCE